MVGLLELIIFGCVFSFSDMFQNINTKGVKLFITLKSGVTCKIQAFANPRHHQGLFEDLVLIVRIITCLHFFSGEAERVEMVIDDVVVEVSKHRGIGRMYLTNFR